jgi:hypothetical protein
VGSVPRAAAGSPPGVELVRLVDLPHHVKRNPWMSKPQDYYERSARHMARVEELLARIATALERR